MKKNGYTTLELLGVIGLFSIIYFGIALNVSKEFNVDFENELYSMKMKSIENNAKIYAENHLEIFNEEKDVYITVNDLAINNYIVSNAGVVIDPRNENKNLNDLKIKLTKDEEKIKVKVLG
ncbi:MAG: hypothetical protein E7172_03100 [Firmicutes bacterium]|nr:hypothetical protein [Bacillota bacterium]